MSADGSANAMPFLCSSLANTTPIALHTWPQHAPWHCGLSAVMQGHTTGNPQARWSTPLTNSTTLPQSFSDVSCHEDIVSKLHDTIIRDVCVRWVRVHFSGWRCA